jgi:hypothetical protein
MTIVSTSYITYMQLKTNRCRSHFTLILSKSLSVFTNPLQIFILLFSSLSTIQIGPLLGQVFAVSAAKSVQPFGKKQKSVFKWLSVRLSWRAASIPLELFSRLFSGGLRDKDNENNFSCHLPICKRAKFCWMISSIIPFVVTVRLPFEMEICTEYWQNDTARGKQICSDKNNNQ